MPQENAMLRAVRLHASSLEKATATHDADGFGLYDIALSGTRIAAIEPAISNGEKGLGGRIVLPGFVDCHTHLDKGHIWPRRPNPDGTFMGALESVFADRVANWSAEDVEARMEFGLRCAFAHGTVAIRTHLDSLAPQDAISWPVFERLRERWAGRIELQASSLIGIDRARDMAGLAALAARVAAAGGVFGAVTYMEPDIEVLLDRVFRTAIERGLELDFHADETQDPGAVTLRLIAEAAKRNGYDGRILVGHCCSLARQDEDEVARTLDAVTAVPNLSVVSLPMCNLYLQDRRGDMTTPRSRGVTLLHELKRAGVNVCVASDNTRDPFYAYGDLDMLEVYRLATRIAHFDHPVADWPKSVAANPAKAMGVTERYGRLSVGGPADFVLFRGRNWTELLSRPESDRIVYRNGAKIDARPPDYSELDCLMEHA